MTKIHENFEGDTFFPEVDWSEWELIEQIEGEQDEKMFMRIHSNFTNVNGKYGLRNS